MEFVSKVYLPIESVDFRFCPTLSLLNDLFPCFLVKEIFHTPKCNHNEKFVFKGLLGKYDKDKNFVSLPVYIYMFLCFSKDGCNAIMNTDKNEIFNQVFESGYSVENYEFSRVDLRKHSWVLGW